MTSPFRRRAEEVDEDFESMRANMLQFSHRFLAIWAVLVYFAVWNMITAITAGLPPWASVTIGFGITAAFYTRMWKAWRHLGRAVKAQSREADEKLAAQRVEQEARRLAVMQEIAEFSDEERAVIDELRRISEETRHGSDQTPRPDDPDPQAGDRPAEGRVHHEGGDGEGAPSPPGDLEPGA